MQTAIYYFSLDFNDLSIKAARCTNNYTVWGIYKYSLKINPGVDWALTLYSCTIHKFSKWALGVINHILTA